VTGPFSHGPNSAIDGYWDQWSKSSLNESRHSKLLGVTLAHLKDADARAKMSPRVPLLMAVRNKLALVLREER